MKLGNKHILEIACALVFLVLAVVYFELYQDSLFVFDALPETGLKWDNFLGLTFKATLRLLEF